MAEQDLNKKYFLDLGGLTTLWNKIKSTFADKISTEAALINVNTSINDINTAISGLSSEVDSIESTVLAIAPKEAETYTKALEAAASLTVGTIIDVKNSETIGEGEEAVTYGKGLYIVESYNPISIKSLSTSSGSDAEEGLEGLNVRIESLEQNAVIGASITAGSDSEVVNVANNKLLIAHDDTFDINSESIKALTHRAIAAKFRGIESIITGIPKFKIEVVDELPTNGISLSTVYLVKNNNTSDDNLFTEYIYVNSKWEKLGEQTIDLTGYVTENKVNALISAALTEYAKTSDIQTFIRLEIQNLKTELDSKYALKSDVEGIKSDVEGITEQLGGYLTKVDAYATYLSKDDATTTYLSKAEADIKGWMTESEIITSIQEGAIGEAIAITDTQIENIINTSNN